MLTLINGNGNQYEIDLPKVQIRGENTKESLAYIEERTGLKFIKGAWGFYEAQATDAEQIVKLFMTHNYKTRYYNNWEIQNTIIIKPDYHTGFDVDSICYDCVKHNGLHVGGLEPGDRLAC